MRAVKWWLIRAISSKRTIIYLRNFHGDFLLFLLPARSNKTDFRSVQSFHCDVANVALDSPRRCCGKISERCTSLFDHIPCRCSQGSDDESWWGTASHKTKSPAEWTNWLRMNYSGFMLFRRTRNCKSSFPHFRTLFAAYSFWIRGYFYTHYQESHIVQWHLCPALRKWMPKVASVELVGLMRSAACIGAGGFFSLLESEGTTLAQAKCHEFQVRLRKNTNDRKDRTLKRDEFFRFGQSWCQPSVLQVSSPATVEGGEVSSFVRYLSAKTSQLEAAWIAMRFVCRLSKPSPRIFDKPFHVQDMPSRLLVKNLKQRFWRMKLPSYCYPDRPHTWEVSCSLFVSQEETTILGVQLSHRVGPTRNCLNW